MSKILDEFFSGLYCPICKTITEHYIQKIDEEGNGKYIAYFAKCNICDHIEDYSINDFEEKLSKK